MPFSFEERPNSRATTHNPPSITFNCVADGEFDAATVKAYAISLTAPSVATLAGILYRQDVRVDPQGYAVYHVTVPYGPRKYDTGSYRFSYDTSGGTIKITNAKASIQRYPATATDFKGAINVKESGGKLEVDGAEIVIPATKITYAMKHPTAVITESQVRYLSEITGMVNSDVWHGFQPGEALLLGCSGSDGTDAEAEAQYAIAYSKNATGLTIGDIASIAKKGHEYAWISYEDYEDTTSDAGKTLPGRKPKAVYVERVYDTIAFGTALGF